MDWKNSTVLITGCASGIGQHMARVLQARGAKLLLTDIDIEKLDAQVAAAGWNSEQVRTRKLDVGDSGAWEAAVDKAVQAFGGLDCLLNIAGVTKGKYIHEADPELIDFIMDVNCRGMMYGTHFAAKHMVPRRSGCIVNVVSAAGLIPVPGMSLYCASKFAIRGFSASCAPELEAHGVHLGWICPDAVATPMLDDEAYEPESMLSFGGSRILTVEEVERAIMDQAIGQKKHEVIVPFSMNFLGRFATAFPGLTNWLVPIFEKKARDNQRRYREQVEARRGGGGA